MSDQQDSVNAPNLNRTASFKISRKAFSNDPNYPRAPSFVNTAAMPPSLVRKTTIRAPPPNARLKSMTAEATPALASSADLRVADAAIESVKQISTNRLPAPPPPSKLEVAPAGQILVPVTVAPTPVPAVPANAALVAAAPAVSPSPTAGPCSWWLWTAGKIGVIVFAAIVFILTIVSSAIANQVAQKSAIAATSYLDSGIDQLEKVAMYRMVLPLSMDFTAARISSTFMTASPGPLNTFVPLMCNMTVCNYTAWTGGAVTTDNEDDVLGRDADNMVYLKGNVNDSANYVRLEASWTGLDVSTAGGVATLAWTVVMPNILLNTLKMPMTSLFQLRFTLGSQSIVIAQESSTFSGTLKIPMAVGTLSQFPFDSYSKTLSVFLTINDPAGSFGNSTKASPVPQALMSIYSVPLSFLLKIDLSDAGVFSHSDVIVQAPVPTAALKAPTAQWSVSFTRPAISQAFPGFIFLAFWVIAIFDVIYHLPFLGTTQKLQQPPMVPVSAALLFAIPGIRRAMPGDVPVGIVFDFGSYYWALLIAIACFMFACARWSLDMMPAPPAPPAKPVDAKKTN